jgi:hypothetical protein
VPEAYSVGRGIIVHNMKGGKIVKAARVARSPGHLAQKTVQDPFPLNHARGDGTMPEAVAGRETNLEKLSSNHRLQPAHKTARLKHTLPKSFKNYYPKMEYSRNWIFTDTKTIFDFGTRSLKIAGPRIYIPCPAIGPHYPCRLSIQRIASESLIFPI